MAQAVSIVVDERQKWKDLVVVTSALDGVTDTLLRMTSPVAQDQSRTLEGAASDMVQRHDEIAGHLIEDEVLRNQVKPEIHGIIDHVLICAGRFPPWRVHAAGHGYHRLCRRAHVCSIAHGCS